MFHVEHYETISNNLKDFIDSNMYNSLKISLLAEKYKEVFVFHGEILYNEVNYVVLEFCLVV